MTFRTETDVDTLPTRDLPDPLTGADNRVTGRRSPRKTSMHAEDRPPAAHPDVVELASRESFPASDPPGWIGVSLGARGGNETVCVPGEGSVAQAGLARIEPDRRPENTAEADHSSTVPERQVGEDRASRPGTAQSVAVRIYRPGRSATQSGRRSTKCWVLEFEPRWAPEIEPLMGWTSSRDTRQQVRLSFSSKESAVAFAIRQGWLFTIIDTPSPKLRPPFRSERLGLWPRPPLRRRGRCGVPKEPVRRTSEGEESREGEVRS